MIEFEFNQTTTATTANQAEETHEIQIEFEFMEDGQERFDFAKVEFCASYLEIETPTLLESTAY